MADDDTQPMTLTRPTTGIGLRRTVDAGFDRAYQRALIRRQQRRQRVDAEVARILDEVATEWRIVNGVPVKVEEVGGTTTYLDPDRGPVDHELARGIGTAIVIVCAAVVLAVFALAMGLAP